MAGTISGTINDIRNGQPVRGAAVAAKPGDHTTTSTDDYPINYSLSLDEGTYDVTIDADGYELWDGRGIVVLDAVTTEIYAALHPKD